MSPNLQTIMGFKYKVNSCLQIVWIITKNFHEILAHADHKTEATRNASSSWLSFYV